MRAIMTVTGLDHVGIFAAVTTKLAQLGVNILDVSQTLMDEYFTAILLCDLSRSEHSIQQVREAMREVEQQERLSIQLQSEEIFKAMHTI
ncbi:MULTISPECIES: ACT domain-containing protein [Kocuria]|jgi:ACT domain-containing protein|uniref:ACT domain-containing protein n=1 Tax=Kocuria TaxID=57493 RepID=UPI00203A5D61|nr:MULTISPECIES: ACT domain-containing protein [Kocuria]MCM3688086.1 ACT domain-containing protein [Kocuria rosea]HST73610.1 ACT domain-containing protein [Kocuria rosea]